MGCDYAVLHYAKLHYAKLHYAKLHNRCGYINLEANIKPSGLRDIKLLTNNLFEIGAIK